MPDWLVRKQMNHADCLVFIVNNLFWDLQWQMKRRAYILENSDLEVEMDEEEYAVNEVYNIVVRDIKKEIHSILVTCYTTPW